MQIVIDIPDELYKEYVLVDLDRGNGKTITYNLLKAIKNGTPLDEIITQIEQARDKDKNAGEYPYNRCIEIIKGVNDGLH